MKIVYVSDAFNTLFELVSEYIGESEHDGCLYDMTPEELVKDFTLYLQNRDD